MPTEPRVPLSRPTRLPASAEGAASAFSAGDIDGYGPANRSCEDLLTRHFGAATLLVSSGTHALELAALALDLTSGDEVIVPSFAFVTTAAAFARVGASLRFVDCDADGNLDLDDLPRAITPRTRAIVALHYAGGCCDLARLTRIAGEAGVLLVEDAAQSIGASFDGRPLGTFGRIGCLSFDSMKNLTAGQGGAVVINDPESLDRCHRIRDRGTNRRDFLAGRAAAYEWTDAGSNFSLSGLNAAVLEPQLRRLEEINERRRILWQRYFDALASPLAAAGARIVRPAPRVRSNAHLFAMVWPSRALRDRFLSFLDDGGIGAAFHYTALHRSSFGRRYVTEGERFPGSEVLADGLARLPLFDALSEAEQSRVIERT
ncbi:MAG: aminotransferase class V-fold PLP-dependent enzyme, partial [Thermoanaerobaculia bacterium]